MSKSGHGVFKDVVGGGCSATTLCVLVSYSFGAITVQDILRWMFLIITFPDLLEIGITISLFTFLGFLFYETLSARIMGKEAESRRVIRTIARYYLASTFLLFLAYFLGYARGNAWLVSIFTPSSLRLMEGIAAFLGFVTMLFPLYPIGRVLSADKAISDVSLPELSQTLVGGLLILFYLAMLWGQTLRTYTLDVGILEASVLLGIVGILGVMALPKETTRWPRLKRLLPWLCFSPWIALTVMGVLSLLSSILSR